jgi:hypothetical protein
MCGICCDFGAKHVEVPALSFTRLQHPKQGDLEAGKLYKPLMCSDLGAHSLSPSEHLGGRAGCGLRLRHAPPAGVFSDRHFAQ